MDLYNSIQGQIDTLIRTASRHNGYVYGEYVNNVLFPRSKDSKCPIQIKDIDVWFEKVSSFHDFLEEMKDNLHFQRDNQYLLSSNNENSVVVNIVISDDFPYVELDIDRLAYQYDDEVLFWKVFPFQNETGCSYVKLEQQILKKEVRISGSIQESTFNRLKSRYPGWKLIFQDRRKSLEDISDFGQFQDWIHEIQLEKELKDQMDQEMTAIYENLLNQFQNVLDTHKPKCSNPYTVNLIFEECLANCIDKIKSLISQ